MTTTMITTIIMITIIPNNNNNNNNGNYLEVAFPHSGSLSTISGRIGI